MVLHPSPPHWNIYVPPYSPIIAPSYSEWGLGSSFIESHGESQFGRVENKEP